MCVGTASHVGKSVLVAALCRIFARRGYHVAPFKAQNMALNSFVTREGAETGRSQAYQARAAGVEPHADMNPVLLKPSSLQGSQAVVLGHPLGHMTSDEYRAFLPELWPQVTAALERLRDINDLVVIEGAGSAAEINLRDSDIVNMRLARHLQAPVLLVGDIDRGGVFASLVGHMELFTAEERALVRGFLINRFRGDTSLLEPGLRLLTERTRVPTAGVIPMLEDWRGEEEDALAIGERAGWAKPQAPVRIAVVRLPYVSNFTDFDALADEPDVDLRLVSTPEELVGVAAILLPGTKSTIADLSWLRSRGLAAAMVAAVAGGATLVGICGGYQMLGRRILDPDGVESGEQESEGLGLLDVETTFSAQKRTIQVEGETLAAGVLGPAGTHVRGYEIHMGLSTRGAGVAPLLRLRAPSGEVHIDGAMPVARADGLRHGEGNFVCGSYLHGLFDEPAARGAFLNRLREALGVPQREGSAGRSDEAIERLADHVEAHLDLDFLANIVGLRL